MKWISVFTLLFSNTFVITSKAFIPTITTPTTLFSVYKSSASSSSKSSIANNIIISSTPSVQHKTTNQLRWASSRDDDYQAAFERNQRRTDVRILLTQRALQSFIYLLISCRDPHTVRWLENTFEFANLENYHGTGALNLTRFDSWDRFLLDLLHRPNDVVVVSARRRGRGQGGWSTNNPYLEDRFVEFRIDIEPVSLVMRLLSVRQQIAQEWVYDLDTLKAVNELILQSYHDRQNQSRGNEVQSQAPTNSLTAPSSDSASALDDSANNRTQNIPGHASIESLASPAATDQYHVFERKTNEYMNNKMMEHEGHTGLPSSPQRRGNFDVLSLLATQEAVHRVLRQYRSETTDKKQRQVALTWLLNFYEQRLDRYFDGDGRYGRADDFLQDLLLTPPSVMVTASQGEVELVDPLRIAEDILRARSQVALDWKQIMLVQVPSDHMQLQKAILAIRMGQTTNPSTSIPQQQEEQQATQPKSSTWGEFE